MLNLCIYVANYLGEPAYLKVVYKIATNTTLLNTTKPSLQPAIMEWRLVLNNDEEKEFKVSVPVYMLSSVTRVALIFELWQYNYVKGDWVYTGRWVHLYINIGGIGS
jgi:hypothetical protein